MTKPPLDGMPPPDLPPPDEDALAHSQCLVEHIREEIAQRGPIPFSRFMELALYTPGLGYYSAGARKFGAEGDFVTAPELSPLFSRCLARQCAEVLEALGGGDILEFGAGSGVMAADILLELERLGRLPGRYLILEVSAGLRQRQRDTLAARAPALLPRVHWLEAWPENPIEGVVLGNEVLDAMPVERFCIGGEGVVSLDVDAAGAGLEISPRAAGEELREAVGRIERALGHALPAGYGSEINLSLPAWMRGLGASLARGIALLIDYGYPRREYYHPQRGMGTLMCHYRHRAHADPLLWPGLQDITAHVDFSAVAEAGRDAGLTLAGFAHQAAFLIGCGLEALFSEPVTDMREQLERARQVKLLTLPGEMGERFKVIGFHRGLDRPLRGFAFDDRRERL